MPRLRNRSARSQVALKILVPRGLWPSREGSNAWVPSGCDAARGVLLIERWCDNAVRGEFIIDGDRTDSKSIDSDRMVLCRSISRWESEGGATAAARVTSETLSPELTNTELVHFRIRVIALENLLIAMLAEGTDHQLDIARKVASYILPRDGHTLHPLTVQAADHITDLVNRAIHFRSTPERNDEASSDGGAAANTDADRFYEADSMDGSHATERFN